MFGIENNRYVVAANTLINTCSQKAQNSESQQEKPQMTEMPRVSFGRDLVKPRTSDTTPLKEFIKNPKFPTDFDVESLRKWATDSGLTFDIDEYGVAKMCDSNGKLIRRISSDYNDPSKIYDDRIFVRDFNGKEADFVKYSFERDICYYHNYRDGFPQSEAKITPDGEWYEKGEKLTIHPVTNEPLNSDKKVDISSNDNSAINEQNIEQELIAAAKSSNFGERPLEDLRKVINENPEIVNKVVDAKDSEGNPLLSKPQICKVLCAAAPEIKDSPEDILAVLADSNAIAVIECANDRGRRFWQCVYDPAPSTMRIKEQMLANKN